MRRMIGKRLIKTHTKKIQRVMLDHLQFGVAVPGGAEALVHARDLIESGAKNGVHGPIAVIDVDLVNCFGRFEWTAVIGALEKLIPELVPWVKWATRCADRVRLPSSEWVASNRGTGQGEPEGPTKAAATIAEAVDKARAELGKQAVARGGAPEGGVWAWYIDDAW